MTFGIAGRSPLRDVHRCGTYPAAGRPQLRGVHSCRAHRTPARHPLRISSTLANPAPFCDFPPHSHLRPNTPGRSAHHTNRRRQRHRAQWPHACGAARVPSGRASARGSSQPSRHCRADPGWATHAVTDDTPLDRIVRPPRRCGALRRTAEALSQDRLARRRARHSCAAAFRRTVVAHRFRRHAGPWHDAAHVRLAGSETSVRSAFRLSTPSASRRSATSPCADG